MKLLEKILFATDFNQSSESALAAALMIAKKFNSEVILLHVMPEFQASGIGPDVITTVATQELQKIQASLIAEGVIVKHSILQLGVPFYHIINIANLHNVNVIVLGSGDHSDNERYPLGITAEKVMQKSDKPVWVAKYGAPVQFQTLACAIDFSNPSRRALTNAIHLARQFQARLRLIHVVPGVSGFYSKLFGQKTGELAESMDRVRKQMESYLAGFDFYNVNWEHSTIAGTPYQEILNFIRNMHADLLLIGSVGIDETSKIQLGSVAKKVAREVPCSIITVKSESIIQLRLDQEITDLETHFDKGRELLEHGFPVEALQQFDYCINLDSFYAPAYEGAAMAFERLGELESARGYRFKAKAIRQKLWEKRVEAEARSRHALFGSGKKAI